MKTKIYLMGILVAFNLPAGATLYQFGTLAGGSALGAIPDYNTLGTSGLTGTSFAASGLDTSISVLTLTFLLQGGSATDLSGYLRLGNSSGSPSYDLTSLVQSQTLNTVSPTSYTIDFTSIAFSTAFNGQNPNDSWTLFFADTVTGDTTTLKGWSLDITAVPEPVDAALVIFAGIAIGSLGVRKWFTHADRRANSA